MMWLLGFIFGCICVTHAQPEDYQTIFERLRLIYYDKRLVADNPPPTFSVGKHNRTTTVLNASLILLQDLDGRQLLSTTKVFIYLNNRYRFTGIQIRVKVCEMWEKNMYGIQDIMKPCSNIQLCDIKKGHLYVTNFWPNPKYFPKSVPVSSFKLEMHADFINGTRLFQMNWYGKAEMYFKEMKNLTISNKM